MTDNLTTELLPCPFCGGESTVERIGKSGYFYVTCNTAYCCDFGKFDTEAEAIEAWNARQERMCHIVKETKTIRSLLHGEVEVTDERCSECEGFMDVGSGVYRNYCPNCGAKVVDA